MSSSSIHRISFSNASQASIQPSISAQLSQHAERPPVPGRTSSIRHLKQRSFGSNNVIEVAEVDVIEPAMGARTRGHRGSEKTASVIDALEASQDALDDIYPPVSLAFSRLGRAQMKHQGRHPQRGLFYDPREAATQRFSLRSMTSTASSDSEEDVAAVPPALQRTLSQTLPRRPFRRMYVRERATSNAPTVAMTRDKAVPRDSAQRLDQHSASTPANQPQAVAHRTTSPSRISPSSPPVRTPVLPVMTPPEEDSESTENASEASSYVESPLADLKDDSLGIAIPAVVTPSKDDLAGRRRSFDGESSMTGRSILGDAVFPTPPILHELFLQSHEDLLQTRAEIAQRKKARRTGSFLCLERPVSLGFITADEGSSSPATSSIVGSPAEQEVTDTKAILRELQSLRAEISSLKRLIEEGHSGCRCERSGIDATTARV